MQQGGGVVGTDQKFRCKERKPDKNGAENREKKYKKYREESIRRSVCADRKRPENQRGGKTASCAGNHCSFIDQ